MGDRLTIRDRALILRVLVPGLETRLRDKVWIRLIHTMLRGFGSCSIIHLMRFSIFKVIECCSYYMFCFQFLDLLYHVMCHVILLLLHKKDERS